MRNLDRRWRITRKYRSHDQNGNFRKFKMADGRHFESSSAVNYPSLIKFGMLVQISISRMDFWQKIEIFQIQDGGRTPYWKSFLAISRRHIGRLIRNLDRRCRITCRYRSHDQNDNFQKFKIADGRHFENSFVSISQPWIIRVLSNLVRRCEWHFEDGNLPKNRNFANSRWRTDAILKIVLAVSWRHIGRLMRNLEQRWRITCRYRSHDQNDNFRKFKMADDRHLKIAFSPYLSRELSDFDQIC